MSLGYQWLVMEEFIAPRAGAERLFRKLAEIWAVAEN